MVNCLVIGSGGREHALAWKISRSARAGKIFVAPGNAGTASVGRNLDLDPADHRAVYSAIRENRIELTVIGPEAPLEAGLADFLGGLGCSVFGPSRAAARLETSKVFAKEFMSRHGIPTAAHETVSSPDEAERCLARWGNRPAVIKVDGLAAGKGVFLCRDRAEKESALERIFRRAEFGEAGRRIIVEEMIEGPELSLMVLSDGRRRFSLLPARDHKRAGENDTGPNTGGMGAFAPVPGLGAEMADQVEESIVGPVFKGLADDGIEYRGLLYFGLMLTGKGPRVLEFNARFGDPETQAVLPLLESDLLEMLASAAAGSLSSRPVFRPGCAVCVVAASGGYPGHYRRGLPISGLEEAAAGERVMIFHAGTTLDGGRVVTDGGRVLGITALGETLAEASERACRAIGRISFEGSFFRRDIARPPAARRG